MIAKIPFYRSLCLILLGPFVVLVLMLTAIILLLSFNTGSRAIAEVSDNLLRETVERIGQAVGVFRYPGNEGELRIKLKPEENRARYKFTGIDGALRFDSRENKMFDPRLRPWYIAGQTATTDTWTSVYIDFGTLELVATRARRVMGMDGEIEGVAPRMCL